MFRDRRCDDDTPENLEWQNQKFERREIYMPFYHIVLAKILNLLTLIQYTEFLRIRKRDMRLDFRVLAGEYIVIRLISLFRCYLGQK